MADAVQHHRSRAWYLRPPVWILGVVLLGLATFGVVQIGNRPAAVLYGEFLDQLDAGNIANVTFAGTQISGNFKRTVEQRAAHGTAPQMVFRSQAPDIGDPTLLPELRKQHVVIDVVSSSNWLSWLGRLPWPMVLIIATMLIVGLVRLRRGEKTSPWCGPAYAPNDGAYHRSVWQEGAEGKPSRRRDHQGVPEPLVGTQLMPNGIGLPITRAAQKCQPTMNSETAPCRGCRSSRSRRTDEAARRNGAGSDQHDQQQQQHAQVGEKAGGRLPIGADPVAESEIACRPYQPADQRGRQEFRQTIAAHAGQQARDRAQIRHEGAGEEDREQSPALEQRLNTIAARRCVPEPKSVAFEEFPAEQTSEAITDRIAQHRRRHGNRNSPKPVDPPLRRQRTCHRGRYPIRQRQTNGAQKQRQAESRIAVDEESRENLIADRAKPARSRVRAIRADIRLHNPNGALDALRKDRGSDAGLLGKRLQTGIAVGRRWQFEPRDKRHIGGMISGGDVGEGHPRPDAAGHRRASFVGRAQQTEGAIGAQPKKHRRQRGDQKDDGRDSTHPA